MVASLLVGQLKNIPTQPGLEKIVICADHDGAEAPSYKAVTAALEHHLQGVCGDAFCHGRVQKSGF